MSFIELVEKAIKDAAYPSGTTYAILALAHAVRNQTFGCDFPDEMHVTGDITVGTDTRSGIPMHVVTYDGGSAG